MTEIKDGGPAFPQHLSFSPVHGCMIESSIPGMSLRDYFAAHETSFPPTSWVQSRFGSQIGGIWELGGTDTAICLSEWRYQMADSMLKAREGK